jgi:hypothetical protein
MPLSYLACLQVSLSTPESHLSWSVDRPFLKPYFDDFLSAISSNIEVLVVSSGKGLWRGKDQRRAPLAMVRLRLLSRKCATLA